MIAIIDYGMGNLASVYKAVRYTGNDAVITADPDVIERSEMIILPGVGAMAVAVDNLEKLGISGLLKDVIEDGKPFLGICLGYQMLFESSEEGMGLSGSRTKGLGILHGKVIGFTEMPQIKVPHMGWNKLSVRHSRYLEGGEYMYFVHSFFPKPEDYNIITSTTRHGVQFAASVEIKNVFATQFHPEKSGTAGIKLLKKWIDTNSKSGNRIAGGSGW